MYLKWRQKEKGKREKVKAIDDRRSKKNPRISEA
jgi:hypothetical protein